HLGARGRRDRRDARLHAARRRVLHRRLCEAGRPVEDPAHVVPALVRGDPDAQPVDATQPDGELLGHRRAEPAAATRARGEAAEVEPTTRFAMRSAPRRAPLVVAVIGMVACSRAYNTGRLTSDPRQDDRDFASRAGAEYRQRVRPSTDAGAIERLARVARSLVDATNAGSTRDRARDLT